jgi:hypothetical protein
MAKEQKKSGGCGGCGCVFPLLLLGGLCYFGYTKQDVIRPQAAKYGVKIPVVKLPDVKIPNVKLPWVKATPTPAATVAAVPTPAAPSGVGNPEDNLPSPPPEETPGATPTPAPDEASDAGPEVTRTFEKEIPVGALKRLVVSVRRGDITITADSPGTIKVTTTRRVDSSADEGTANRWLDAAKVAVTPAGPVLKIVDTVPATLPGTDASVAPPREALDVEVHVPPGWEVNASTLLGNVRSAGPFRRLELNVATGDVLAEGVQVGEVTTLKVGAGSISFSGTGGVLSATTGSGDIYIGEEKKPAVVDKRIEATAGIGNVFTELLRAPQSQLAARSTVGDVQVRLPRNVKAKAEITVTKGKATSALNLNKRPDGSLAGALNGGGTTTLRMETTTGNARLEGR